MIAALALARSGLRFAAPYAGSLALIAAGIGAAELYEHKAPWGLAAKRAALVARIDGRKGYRVQLTAMTADRDAWRAANGRCEALRREEAAAAAGRVTAASEHRVQASSDAFEQGYVAGRAAGRQACGGTSHATSAAPDRAGGSAGDGMRDPPRDFADAWKRGAYRPGGALSGGG